MTADVPTTRAISDEAVEAAARALYDALDGKWSGPADDDGLAEHRSLARRALTAALPHLAQPSNEWAHVRCERALAAEKRAHADTMRLLNETEAQSSGRGADHAREAVTAALAPIESLIEADGGAFLKPGTKIKRVTEDRRRDLGAMVTTSMVTVKDVRDAITEGRAALAADEVTGR